MNRLYYEHRIIDEDMAKTAARLRYGPVREYGDQDRALADRRGRARPDVVPASFVAVVWGIINKNKSRGNHAGY